MKITAIILVVLMQICIFFLPSLGKRISEKDIVYILLCFVVCYISGAVLFAAYVNTEWQQCESQGGKINVRWSEALEKYSISCNKPSETLWEK